MVLFNYSTKELTAKVVYYGPGLCGKTTNLQWVHEKLPIKHKGKMLSLATETDRTLFFDFLPIELGTIRGMKTRIQLYTVPGQVFYNATRRMVLKGADGVVFVCDSQEPMLDANLESFENLRQNLEANEIDPDEIPTVLQFNKRDLPNALPIEILNERLNDRGLPFFEAVAVKGLGVEETLKGVTATVFRALSTRYGPGPAVDGATPALPVAPPPAVITIPPMAPAPPLEAPEAERIETADFEEPDMPLDEEFELPPPPPPALDRVAERARTLVSDPDAAEELRRKISRFEPELSFDTLEEEGHAEEEDIEEISLEPEDEISPAPEPAAPPPLPAVSLRPASATLAQPPTVIPVSVHVVGGSGQTDISIPLEVVLNQGRAQVQIHLRLTLNLKLTP
jgi:signal recognition particle receptor subunit beta